MYIISYIMPSDSKKKRYNLRNKKDKEKQKKSESSDSKECKKHSDDGEDNSDHEIEEEEEECEQMDYKKFLHKLFPSKHLEEKIKQEKVFDKMDFPNAFTLKIIGKNEDNFMSDVLAAIAKILDISSEDIDGEGYLMHSGYYYKLLRLKKSPPSQ